MANIFYKALEIMGIVRGDYKHQSLNPLYKKLEGIESQQQKELEELTDKTFSPLEEALSQYQAQQQKDLDKLTQQATRQYKTLLNQLKQITRV